MSSAKTPEKLQSIITAAVFCLFILGFAAAHLLMPDAGLSRSERRKLQQLPELSAQAFISGEYMTQLEDYMSDQFPMRDELRTLQSAVCFYVFRQLDNNGIYLIGDTVYKSDPALDENAVRLTAEKINEVCEKYLTNGNRVWYSVIPDKNYFAADSGYPTMDYDKLISILDEKINNLSYLDIFDTLDITDYYRTDIHWRQEKLPDTSRALLEMMGVSYTPAQYEENVLYPFYGAFYGQAGLPVEPDELVYMTSPFTQSARVTALDSSAGGNVYEPERINDLDGYNVFLSGAQPLITVENSNAQGGELILFRDSFGSSIAPLLLESYSRITLVDLRYISTDLLGDYVDFEGADILFLYSTTLINSGGVLR